jgi:hypothetical protein
MEDRIKTLQEWRRSRTGRRFAIIELAVSMILVIAILLIIFLLNFGVTHSDPDHTIAIRVKGGLGRLYYSSHIHLLLGIVMLVAAIVFIMIIIILMIDNHYLQKKIYRKYRSEYDPDPSDKVRDEGDEVIELTEIAKDDIKNVGADNRKKI